MYSVDKLDSIKKRVYTLIIREVISFDDIKTLSNLKLFDLHNLDTRLSFKDSVLYSIYINPYLLSNDYLINLDNFDKSAIAKILIKRYNEETYEYYNLYKNKEISEMGFINNITYLKMIYFKNSILGRKIEQEYKKEIANYEIGKQLERR